MLSPTLFAVYMDDLSTELNNLNSGCYVGSCLLNHLMFADDLCVLCPSARNFEGGSWIPRLRTFSLGSSQCWVIAIFRESESLHHEYKSESESGCLSH